MELYPSFKKRKFAYLTGVMISAKVEMNQSRSREDRGEVTALDGKFVESGVV